MSRNIGTLAKIQNIWKTLTRKTETPREFQERSDLYKIALAATFRELRLGVAPASSPTTRIHDGEVDPMSMGKKSTGGWIRDRSALESLYDRATDSLEHETKAHEMPLRSLRYHVQSLIQPQAFQILETCKRVDDDLQVPRSEADDDDIIVDVKVLDRCKQILEQERLDVLGHVENFTKKDALRSDGSTSSMEERRLCYLRQKLDAMETLWNYFEWESSQPSDNLLLSHQIVSKQTTPQDAFGYTLNANERINRSIRYYQLVNFTKAILIKQQLGFATLALRSTIEHAGRGVFVDGFAPAGTLMAFFPGPTWPKEHLINVQAVQHIFKHDPKHQLSMRYDDMLVDSRKEPYTVLDNEHSNALAIAHIVNHPGKEEGDGGPNCSTVMLDFWEKYNWKECGLDRYIPNTYAKPPMMLGPQAFDREKVCMHGLGLVAMRDLENEELFYDYRLSPGSGDEASNSYPAWYHVCNEEEVRNRWSGGE